MANAKLGFKNTEDEFERVTISADDVVLSDGTSVEYNLNNTVNLSKEEKKVLEDIIYAGGIEGIKEGINNIATSLEDIGLDNTATIKDVITRLREEDTYIWHSLSINIADDMGLEPLMPLRGSGHLFIERNNNKPTIFTIKYQGNICYSDEIKVFIANQPDSPEISNVRIWREIGGGQPGAVKSVQRGTLASAAAGGTNILINEVNSNKSIIVLSSVASRSNANTATTLLNTNMSFRFLDNNTIVADRGGASAITSSISWQVIEFY